MLSSGAAANQYLRPEYLTPLPTTLDAKKSPLALLAQTCSQIGADTPNSKLLQSSEKSKSSKSETPRDKASPAGEATPAKSSFKPYESVTASRDKAGSPEDRSSTSSASSRVRTPQGKRCPSNQSAVSPRASPAAATSAAERKSPATSPGASAPVPSAKASPAPAPPPVSSASEVAAKEMSLGAYKPPSHVPVSSAAAAFLPYSGLSLPVDMMAGSLMSRAGALNPYLSYARLKGPPTTGGEGLMSVCRDPYCTGCALGSHKSAACPAGCAQCDHAAAKPSAAAAAAYLGGHGPAAAAYAHAQLAALAAASQLPYVCNWIAGDAAYCGKRFGTSDELLQHLRSHTTLAAAAAVSVSEAMHPLLHRAAGYPTPPLSPLATARYHPYSKPSLLPPGLAASSLAGLPLPHPSLSPYFSPYSLYGPRLGAASTMHP